jgi:hypothetical protein
LWKKNRRRFDLLEEDYDEEEKFDWWTWDDPDIYYAMGTKYKSSYMMND